MESEKVTIEREELYRQVRTEPIFGLAPKYGISNVASEKDLQETQCADSATRLLGKDTKPHSSGTGTAPQNQIRPAKGPRVEPEQIARDQSGA